MADRLIVEDLWIGYRRRDVGVIAGRRTEPRWGLREVSFTVAEGEFLGVVGHNGAGKTTLLQAIAGVLRPTRGRIEPRGRVASLVDLTAGFNRELSANQNLRAQAVLLGLTRRQLQRIYDDIVDFAGLETEMLAAPMRMYSSGMGLRLGFSLVVHTQPEILVVDEVLAVGDEDFRRRCLERINLLRRQGCAMIVASHDLVLIGENCDRACHLDNGRIVAIGAPDSVIGDYRQRPAPQTDDLRPLSDRPMF